MGWRLPSEEDKVAMIAADPGRFLTTPHYDATPILLVSLDAVDVEEAREIIIESWRVRAPRALVRAWDATT